MHQSLKEKKVMISNKQLFTRDFREMQQFGSEPALKKKSLKQGEDHEYFNHTGRFR